MINASRTTNHFIELIIYSMLSVVVAAIVVDLMHNNPVGFVRLIAEDSYGDYFTVLNYVLAGSLIIAFSYNSDLHWQKWVWRLVGAFCFFVAAEEISWGQRIFIVATPDWLRESNLQNEISIHNLEVLDPLHSKSHEYLSYLILTWIGVSVILAFLRRWLRLENKTIFLFFCPVKLAPIFLLVPFFFLSRSVIRADEIVEILFSLALLTYILDLFVQHSLQKEYSGIVNAGVILGVVSIVLFLAVVLTYWHSIASIHHAATIRLFLEDTVDVYSSVGMNEQSEHLRLYIDNLP